MSIEDAMLKLKIASANLVTRITRSAALFGIIAAVAGPFFLLAIGGRGTSGLPWYVWTITFLSMLLVIGRGRYLFMLDSREDEAISIRPDRR